MSRSFALAGDHTKALEQFQQSLAKQKPLNDREGMTESHYNLALSLLAQRNLAAALENIRATAPL